MELRAHYNEWHTAALAGPAGPTTVAERRFFAWAVKLLAPEAGASLLDVACGAGGFVEYAAGAGLRVTGTDLSDVAIAAARARVPTAEFSGGRR